MVKFLSQRKWSNAAMGLSLAACLFASTRLVAADTKAVSTNNTVAQPIEIPGVHNAFKVNEKIYSGSQPEGDPAFAALARLGVKTIVSVDGSKPDLTAARKYGLTYIHLPFGYDGVPTNRLMELAKAATAQPGPFFVHCHHGKHRGPTAVAVMCEASAGWSKDRAEIWMREAGTSPDYAGLYRSAREFTMPPPAKLAAIGKLPETAATSSVVDAMVSIDEHFDRLKQSQAAGWKALPGQVDVSPAHEATLLWEQFRELARLPDAAARPADYRTKLEAAEQSANTLREALKKADAPAAEAALKQATQSCAACHKQHRN